MKLATFLKDNDAPAFESYIPNEKKYKMKFKTVQKEEHGPLDVEIKIFENTDEETQNDLPYVVDFQKGATGDKFDLVEYYNFLKENCFAETKPENDEENK